MFNNTSAPLPFRFNDKDYAFHPITFRDLGAIDNYVRGKYIEAARASITDELTERERRETLDAAFRVSGNISFLSADGLKVLDSVDGIMFFAKLSLSHHEPGISIDTVAEIMNDKANMEIFVRLLTAQFKKKPRVGSDPTPRKKTARKKSSRTSQPST